MDAIAYGGDSSSQLAEAAQSASAAHIEDALEGDRHGV
jgi:ribose transport system ATP-binding protein